MTSFSGISSGRSQLPETLDSPDDEAGALSPAPASVPGDTDAAERDFFATVSRGTADVVAEEVAEARSRGLRVDGLKIWGLPGRCAGLVFGL